MTITESYKNSGLTVMSNFDHSIDRDVEKKIKETREFAQYAGWDFCGYVVWDNNKWQCEVWVYGSPREIITADSLEDIMDKVSKEYGNQ